MSVQKSSQITKTRDAERSRAVILSAALEEFALFGLGGARIDRIAERSNLNKRLIYYYFTDKDQLFQAVLESAYEQIRESEKKLNLQSLEPATAVRTLVEFTWNYYLEHPEFLTLLNSANLHKARHIQESPNARALNSPLIELLGEILEKGRLSGEFSARALGDSWICLALCRFALLSRVKNSGCSR